ncbi:hypothetical protein P153DRAFT_382715 [Dothidotthia symphoricarpi CBS 119687]|uniref:Uncharacterized protein n=1 Tax=Dothidotthia symphoricarpi CBS 119687 TaxID=1392245 RepID=A0A6A6AMW3_9PLEO|nr:uncharacterized protein P153DRAFT_382715 [Dothidotthia symphoricarpi CBS 119687]KAF2131821.1 hypothetical protein P153DRAFT_382715 [Dothidotthia symphoricarpi CBS 119687]
MRDSTGVFLIDFLAHHPDYNEMSENTRSLFRPRFVHRSGYVQPFGILSNEDELGRTPFHVFIQTDFLYTSVLNDLSLPLDTVAFDVNRYDCRGRTPIMGFLQQAVEHNLGNDFINTKMQLMINWGANVNSCSRGGSTILQFAAKKALPKLLDMLLATSGIQVDHCDNEGNSALDYAAHTLRRSQSMKATAILTARSLKSITSLLGVMSNRFGRTRASQTRSFSKRSLETLVKLKIHRQK